MVVYLYKDGAMTNYYQAWIAQWQDDSYCGDTFKENVDNKNRIRSSENNHTHHSSKFEDACTYKGLVTRLNRVTDNRCLVNNESRALVQKPLCFCFP